MLQRTIKLSKPLHQKGKYKDFTDVLSDQMIYPFSAGNNEYYIEPHRYHLGMTYGEWMTEIPRFHSTDCPESGNNSQEGMSLGISSKMQVLISEGHAMLLLVLSTFLAWSIGRWLIKACSTTVDFSQ